MPSFIDIAPLKETVTLRGSEFEVHGIGIGALADVIYRFPALGDLLPKAVAPGATPAPIDVKAIIDLGPQIVAALIAGATGKEGDAAEEEALARLAIGEQVEFIEAIIRLSFPGGLLPFVERITRLLNSPVALVNGAAGKALDTTSRPPLTN